MRYVFAHLYKKKYKKDKPKTKEMVTDKEDGDSVERMGEWEWGQKDERK